MVQWLCGGTACRRSLDRGKGQLLFFLLGIASKAWLMTVLALAFIQTESCATDIDVGVCGKVMRLRACRN
jgi:hypothetical protein